MGKNISEDLFAAMQTIVKEEVKALNFNKTIRCCITKADKAEEGEYTVNDGVNTFTAYSDNTSYKENNYVYVLIPNGDYTQQKTIIGKYITTDSSNYTYIKPSETYVDITGNLLTVKEDIYELTANGAVSEVEIQRFDIKERAYDRIIVRGSFRSWLNKYRLIGGNYGLRLDVVEEIPTTLTSTQKKYHSYKLDSRDMYGDAYNFETFYEQEAIFDISNLKHISQMRLVFYQDCNFKNNICTIAPLDSPNLFMEQPYVSLGYDLNNFDEDKVLLYSFDSDTYADSLTEKMKNELGIIDDAMSDATRQGLIDDYNSKDLKLRWVKINSDAGVDTPAKVSVVDTKTMPENTVIHWYRYNLQQGISDDLAGAFWEEIIENKNSFELNNFLPDVTKQVERIKVIIESPSREHMLELLSADEQAIQALKDSYGGDHLSQEEVEAARDLYNTLKDKYLAQAVTYESDIYELKNEIQVPDYGSVDLINGLTLRTDEEGYNGTYFIYNKSGKINSRNEYVRKRYITADYSSLVAGNQDLDTAEKITWLIPITNTMIQMPAEGIEYDTSAGNDEVSKSEDGNYLEITRYGIAPTTEPGSEEADSTQQIFRIKEYYSQTATNNTIICRLVKNNRLYEAAAELRFGTSGTNGTDYTFTLRFTNNEPALPVMSNNTATTAIVEPLIYDADNNDVTNNFSNFEYSWYCEGDGGVAMAARLDGSNNQPITVTSSDINRCKYYILKCKVTGNVTLATQVKKVTLSTFLPIPVKASGYDFLTIDGADTIQYDTSGTSPEYYNNPYTLYNMITAADKTISQQKVSAIWRMSFGSDCAEGATTDGSKFYPQVSEDGKLTVPSLYLSGCGRQISVDGYVNGTCVWTQPLYIYIDAYGSALMNSWDGNLTIDEENGTIISAMIGAGIKNPDNSFNAVLMGDVGKAGVSDATGALSSYYNGIGLYGFNEGIRSFGLNVNGKAFFGAAGRGQILIDGNSSELQSSNYKLSNEGLHLQLDTGVITSKGPHSEGQQAVIKIDPTVDVTKDSSPYFEVTSQKGVSLIEFGPKLQKLRSGNFNGSAKKGMIIDLSAGYIQSFGPSGSYVRLSGSTESSDFFVIHDGNSNKDIFKASRSTSVLSEKENAETIELNDSFKDEYSADAYISNLLAPGYTVSNSVQSSEELKHIIRGLDYEPCAHATSHQVFEDSNYKIILETKIFSQDCYTGTSAQYPVTTGNDAKKEGAITSSKCVAWKYGTKITTYEIIIPFPRLVEIYGLPANADKTFINQTLRNISDNEIVTRFLANKSTFQYNILNQYEAYEVTATIDYKTKHLDAYISNGNYFLQSSNYDGKTAGARLDISKGTFTTFGSDGSSVKLNGNGTDLSGFFSIYDASGIDSKGKKKGKYIFYAGGAKTGTIKTPGGDTMEVSENGKFYLQSSNYAKAGTDGFANGQGCKLDLSKGTFLTYDKYGASVLIDGTGSNALFKVQCTNSAKEAKTVFLINNDGGGDPKYYLKTVDYSFADATGMKLDLKEGKITAFKFEIRAYKDSSKQSWIKINSNADKPLEIHGVDDEGHINTFYVNYAGKVSASYITATSGGKIGPFKINSNALYTDSSTFGGTGVYLGSAGLSVSSGKFKVDSSGNIWSKGDLHIDGVTTVKGTIQQGGTAGTTSYKFGKNEAQIGPWKIGKDAIETDAGSYLGSTGTLKLETDTSGLNLSASCFIVNVDSKSSATSHLYLGGSYGTFQVDAGTYMSLSSGTSSPSINIKAGDNFISLSSSGINISAGNNSISLSSSGVTLKTDAGSFGINSSGHLVINGTTAYSESETIVFDTPVELGKAYLYIQEGIITDVTLP